MYYLSDTYSSICYLVTTVEVSNKNVWYRGLWRHDRLSNPRYCTIHMKSHNQVLLSISPYFWGITISVLGWTQMMHLPFPKQPSSKPLLFYINVYSMRMIYISVRVCPNRSVCVNTPMGHVKGRCYKQQSEYSNLVIPIPSCMAVWLSQFSNWLRIKIPEVVLSSDLIHA